MADMRDNDILESTMSNDVNPIGRPATVETSFNSLVGVDATILCRNHRDMEGNPAGGIVLQYTALSEMSETSILSDPSAKQEEESPLRIQWQDGPVNRQEDPIPNGVFVEDVIEATYQRLAFYQTSPFNCEENAGAMKHLAKALEILQRRRFDRRERGVEGKHVR